MASLAEDYYRLPEYYVNVVYLDDDPEKAAQMHCDRQLRKAIVDACQILSTVWHVKAGEVVYHDWGAPLGAAPFGELAHLNSVICGQRIYKPGDAAHPCVQWVALYGGNYDWLYRMGGALLDEYRYRQGRIHACTPTLRTLELMPPALRGTAGKWCDAPAVLPSEYVVESTVESYRAYQCNEKKGFLCYTKREPPEWAAAYATFIDREL